jgi:hypothetical protein
MCIRFKNLVILVGAFCLMSLSPSTLAETRIALPPKGEYATIHTQPTIAIVEKLQDNAPQKELEIQIIQHSGNYIPTVLFTLANRLYQKGDIENALFWLHASRLRVKLDAELCTDKSSQAALFTFDVNTSPGLRKKNRENLLKLKKIIEQVIQWDERTPYNYDRRWISLHGTRAIDTSLGNVVPLKPLTVPKDQWDVLAQKNREAYRQAINTAINTLQKETN